jgi:hypothetical protein
MNFFKNHKKSMLLSIFVAAFMIACGATTRYTVTDIDQTTEPDGTIHRREHTEEIVTTDPPSGTLTVDLGGLQGSVGLTTQNSGGETTETEVPEGETTEIPEDTESVTIDCETTEPCTSCGQVHANQRLATLNGILHQVFPFEIRTGYMAWPDAFLDVTASVSVRGKVLAGQSGIGGLQLQQMTPSHAVEAHAREIGQYFRDGGMGLTAVGGIPTGTPLPSFSDADVIPREILFIEETDTGANFHYYDTRPFRWLRFTLNGTTYSLQTPGTAIAKTAVKGYWHVAIPVPASELSTHVEYSSVYRTWGSNDLGGRSTVTDLTLL